MISSNLEVLVKSFCLFFIIFCVSFTIFTLSCTTTQTHDLLGVADDLIKIVTIIQELEEQGITVKDPEAFIECVREHLPDGPINLNNLKEIYKPCLSL